MEMHLSSTIVHSFYACLRILEVGTGGKQQACGKFATQKGLAPILQSKTTSKLIPAGPLSAPVTLHV